MVLLFDKISAERARRGRSFVPTWIFASCVLRRVEGVALEERDCALVHSLPALDTPNLGGERAENAVALSR
jgi:hypothetical protein